EEAWLTQVNEKWAKDKEQREKRQEGIIYKRQSKNVLSKQALMVGMASQASWNTPTSSPLKATRKRACGVLKIPSVN
ncbi:MAG TPA: hypothetical protein VIY29_30665, partial [Ktedonobacteraceae bacterium]